MAEADIQAALMARVESLSLSPAIPVAWPGVPFTGTSGDYLRVSHLRAEPTRWAIRGGDPLDRRGFLQLDLFTVIGPHQVKADVIADSILAHFPRDLKLTSGSAVVRVVKAWARPGQRDPNGTHWQTPVQVDYRASG